MAHVFASFEPAAQNPLPPESESEGPTLEYAKFYQETYRRERTLGIKLI